METIDILGKALNELGYQSRPIHFGLSKKRFMQIEDRTGRVHLTLSAGSPLYPFATASARLVCRDKTKSYDFAAGQGISVPKSVYLSTEEIDYKEAVKLLNTSAPLIVKPARSTLSQGLTLNVRTKRQLSKAIKYAQKFPKDVVVQQQIEGEEIRFPLVNGKAVAAILRQTPRVIGNGTATVTELIRQENELREQLTDTMVPYPQLDKALVAEPLLSSQKVPAMGEVVELNRNTMIMGGASIYNVLAETDPSYIELVEKLAGALGKGFVTVDMIVQDYTQPANNHNYWFLEFNLTPALRLFYSCRDGKHLRIAEDYLAPMMVRAMQ